MESDAIKLKDYYSQRELNPDGRTLARYQYKYEYETIYKDNLEFNISVRFIGSGEGYYSPPYLFFIHVLLEDRYYVQDFFKEDESVEVVHEKIFKQVLAFKKKKENSNKTILTESIKT